jgi:nucleoside-diphosphate-sugar epimerase
MLHVTLERPADIFVGDMLSNFLAALTKTGVTPSLKRIVLVTGAKQYGVHLGVPKNPMQESDPWLRDKKTWPPNFYYRQQDVLRAFCAENPHVSWVVTYPNDVIGFARGNFMNLALSLGLYAAVNVELQNRNGKEEVEGLIFPGSETFYTKFDCFTSSKLHAQFCAWAALEPRAGNEAFNVVNGDVESWQNLWPRVAGRFGVKVKEDQFAQKPGEEGSVMEMAKEPPIEAVAGDIGLKGKTPQSKVEQRIDLIKWSQREDVKEVWNKLAEREGLEKDAFEKATWGFLGFVLGRNFDLVISMSKARKLGWTGYVDTWDSLAEVFDDLEKEKVLPKTK